MPVLISNYIMGKDEDIFHDANSFLPERWLRENASAEKVNLFASQIFGYGARSCVGKSVRDPGVLPLRPGKGVRSV